MERPLPDKYSNQIKPIAMEGVKGFVWPKKLLLQFLNDEVCKGYAVLGGDVIRLVGSKMEYTYDNWGIDGRRQNESFENYCERSRLLSLDYIQKYPDSDDILFSPVITSEVTAGL